MHKSWYNLLEPEFKKKYFTDLMFFVRDERKQYTIHPSSINMYSAFSLTPFNKVKVVILGQDPYHGPNQAHGLSFSVLNNKSPPSLVNIFKELRDDLNIDNTNGNLTKWAENGVLLLNTVLTVREGQPKSHSGKGWEKMTDTVIELLSNKINPIVFILWGNDAKQKAGLINNRHNIISSTHPSPFSAYNGFFGSKPFSRCNNFLKDNGKEEIDWET